MPPVLASLLTVLALIAIGHALKRGGVPGDDFWRPAARLVYFLFLPALLVRLIALAELDPGIWRAQAAAAGAVLAVTAALWGLRTAIARSGGAFTSVVQGGVRHNTFIGLAFAGAAFGEGALVAFAMLLAAIVPLVNAIAVVALARFGDRAGDGAGIEARPRIARAVALNPLILACVLGAALNVSGLGLPLGSEGVVRLLGQPALPLGLLVVGAGLRPSSLARVDREVVAAAVARLLVYPALALGFAWLLGVGGDQRDALLLLAVLPTAASAYVLAGELGGDAPLMARIITVETALAAVTIPAWLAFAGGG